jgi:hemolysin type calcium-binding protein
MNRLRSCSLALVLLTLALAAPAAAAVDADPGAGNAPAAEAPPVAPVAAPAETLAALEDRKGPVPKEEPADIEVDGKKVETAEQQGVAEPFWSFGVTKYQSGLNCSIVDAPYYETQVTSQIGYGGTATVPKVGERFNVVLLYSHPGYACSGGFLADLYAEVEMPEGAQLAIDQTHGIGCYTTTRAAPNTWVDVTNSTWTSPNGTKGKWCQTDGSTGKFGAINLGYRMLVTGTMFQIVVPAIATKELKGAAQTPKVAEFISATESVVTTVRTVFPTVWANILGFYAPSVSYPTPSSTQITPGGAKTTAYVYNHFKTGNAFVDLGTTTSYGQSSNPIPLASYDSYTINATWDTLTPGTTYHWRARFVDANGTTTYGPDQQFTTPAGSVVERDGERIELRGYGRVSDDVRVSFVNGKYKFTNPLGALVPRAGCVAVTANEVTCDPTGVTQLKLNTSFGDDLITVDPGVTTTTLLLGGGGNDRITGGSGIDKITGGDGADVMNGGAGVDVAKYSTRTETEPVTVTIDDVRNDGGAVDVSGTLKDDVRGDIERVIGGRGADSITGSAGDNILRGGGGADKLIGLGGNDQLLAADNAVDVTIDCGTGTADSATVDLTPVDPTAAGCETVTKS